MSMSKITSFHTLIYIYSHTHKHTQQEKAETTAVHWQDRDINLGALRTGVGTKEGEV